MSSKGGVGFSLAFYCLSSIGGMLGVSCLEIYRFGVAVYSSLLKARKLLDYVGS